MWIYRRQKRAPLYVVDNAGYGRVYVFRDEKYARDFARGVITRTAAIKDNCLRLVRRQVANPAGSHSASLLMFVEQAFYDAERLLHTSAVKRRKEGK